MHQHKVFTRTGHEFERNSLRILRATCCPMGEANTGTRARRRGLWGLGPTGVGTNPLAGGCASAPDRCCSAKARLRRGQNDCDRPCVHPGPSPDSICLRAMWWGEPDESRQDVWRPTAGESSSYSVERERVDRARRPGAGGCSPGRESERRRESERLSVRGGRGSRCTAVESLIATGALRLNP
jgi:hypothetical protein